MKHRNDAFVDFTIKNIDENPNDWEHLHHNTWKHKNGILVAVWGYEPVEVDSIYLNRRQSKKIRLAFENLAKYKIIEKLKSPTL